MGLGSMEHVLGPWCICKGGGILDQIALLRGGANLYAKLSIIAC